jgi:thioredoxin 1
MRPDCFLRDFITEQDRNSGYDMVENKKRGGISMSILKITKENFEAEVLNSDKPVLLDFFATWCGPCRMVGPILEEIAQENESIKVCKIDVDQDPELANRFKVSSIPLLVVMQDGKVVNQALGAKPKDQILKLLP